MESDPAPEAADLLLLEDEETAAAAASCASSLSNSSSVFGSEDSRSATSSGEIPILPDLIAPLQEGLQIAASTGAAGADGAVPEARRRCLGWKGGGTVAWGAASTVGRRKEMEDAMAVAPIEFAVLTCEQVGGCVAAPGSGGTSLARFFGVYDGHGGLQVADYCAKRIHEVVAEEWNKAAHRDCWKKRWEVAFSQGFERVDDEIIDEEIAADIVGSTAVVVVLTGCQIISSNCGDSRAVLCRGSQTIQLTVDHKPDREDELMRIENLGGKVINWRGPRVLGVLAMSRSIGDRYMRPWVIPVPEVSFVSRNDDDDCLIIASDGLWDVMSVEEVGDLARRLLKRHRKNGLVDDHSPLPSQAVADHLAKLAYQKNSSDNISVIVVDLKSRSRRKPRQI